MGNINGSKALADALTLSRALLGAVLVWLGLAVGPDGLPLAMCVLIVAWTTDVLDGALARHEANLWRSWVGEHDLLFDVSVAVGVCVYLMFAGFISTLAAGAYLICAGPVAAYFRSKAFANAVQAVAYASLVLIGLFDAPLFGGLAIVWMGLAITITWPRFARRQVPEFLGGIRDLLRNRR